MSRAEGLRKVEGGASQRRAARREDGAAAVVIASRVLPLPFALVRVPFDTVAPAPSVGSGPWTTEPRWRDASSVEHAAMEGALGAQPCGSSCTEIRCAKMPAW